MHRGEFLVQVDLQPTAPLHVVDPYATRIEVINTRDHCVLAWVGADNLEKVASLPEVKQIWPMNNAVVFRREEFGTDPQKKIDQNIIRSFEGGYLRIPSNKSPALDYNKTVSVVIEIQPPSSVDVVDPYLTRIRGHSQEYFRVYATVNLTETERIASLPEVAYIYGQYEAGTLSYLVPYSQTNVSRNITLSSQNPENVSIIN